MSDTDKRGYCLRPGLGCIVLVWILIATISLVLSYSIARSTGHVSPFVPAISDITSKNPEGAIFAELFNATAVFTLIMMAIRYYQVKMINRQVEGGESTHLSQLNTLSVVFGIGSALGASFVANFRSSEVSNSYSVMHIIGAALLFTSGTAYCWAQTFTTYQLTKFNVNDKSVFTGRLVISSILTLSTLLFLICGGLGYHDKTPADTVLIVGNLAEWLAAWCFGLFGLTFFKEFQKLSLNVQCIPRCSGKNSDALKYSTIPVSGLDENITDSD